MIPQENDIVALGVMLRPGVNFDIDLERDEHLVQPVDLDPGLSLVSFVAPNIYAKFENLCGCSRTVKSALWTLCGG